MIPTKITHFILNFFPASFVKLPTPKNALIDWNVDTKADVVSEKVDAAQVGDGATAIGVTARDRPAAGTTVDVKGTF